MDHLFITINRDALDQISQISAVRTIGGDVTNALKGNTAHAFTSNVYDGQLKRVLDSLKQKVSDIDEKFVIVSMDGEKIRSIVKTDTKKALYPERIWIDAKQLTWPFMVNSLIGNRSLEALCAYFKVSFQPNGDSAEDCLSLMQVYTRMMQRYKVGLLADNAIRDFGGDTLEGLRKFVGF